jgi:hypothetical protein
MLVNGLGAVATGITLIVVLVAKFASGAWVSALLIVIIMVTMMRVRRHYTKVAQEVQLTAPIQIKEIEHPIVIVPIDMWSLISQRAMQFALTLSPEIYALHVATEEENNVLEENWNQLIVEPIAKAGGTPPKLVKLESPYRLVLKPILDYVLETESKNPGRQICIIVPELVERHWYHYPMHNQRAELLKAMLLLRCGHSIVLISVPWHINA